MLSSQDSPSLCWRLIQTQANVEIEAARRLEADGFEVFVPLSRYWCRPRHKRRPILVTRSAFGPYFFCESQHPPVEIYRGHVVHFGDQYIHIRDEEVAKLLAQPFVIDESVTKARKRFACGAAVTGKHALFGVIDGTIVSVNGRCAVVELSINRMRVQLPLGLLQAA